MQSQIILNKLLFWKSSSRLFAGRKGDFTDFLLSTFEFERQNIAGCCKQTFCVQFSSKAKYDFFSFLSCLLNGRKNSNFYKIAVE